jgi:putative PIN family toxin of toxin-antitoxin system
MSPAILDEVARTLLLPRIARRYHVTAPEVTELGRLLTTRSIVLTSVPPIPPMARDPADDHLLALAVAGHADHIVSGDDDLLSLGRYASIPILRPAMYARLLEGS